MDSSTGRATLRLGLPKGSMQRGVFALLSEAGVEVKVGSRGYRPTVSLPDVDAKILKPQNIIEMVHVGSRDFGFAGADWVSELGITNLVELLDTELDPVRIVAAVPRHLLVDGALPERHLVVASEYEQLTRKWIEERGLEATFVRSYGATEVFPPEDADCIVDNTATGATLRENGLVIADELMRSSTRLYANAAAMQDVQRRERIERFVLLLESVLEARKRVMLEVNVGREALESVVGALPCLREPTIAPLHGESGYAVKAAVPRAELPQLIPEIKQRGGTDIVVSGLSQIVP
jgi:ATP phosphoribosyltransferase